MAAPAGEVGVENLGRYIEVSGHWEWTQERPDNLDDQVFLPLDYILSSYVTSDVREGVEKKPRYAVEFVEWNAGDNVSGQAEFDSFPIGTGSRIFAFTPVTSSGEEDFRETSTNGARVDPNPLQPGNIAIRTQDALPGSKLYIRMLVRVKGRRA